MRKAALELSQKTEAEKNAFLKQLATELKKYKTIIIDANHLDIKRARKQHLSSTFLQRLTLDEKGINDLMNKVLEMQKLVLVLERL